MSRAYPIAKGFFGAKLVQCFDHRAQLTRPIDCMTEEANNIFGPGARNTVYEM